MKAWNAIWLIARRTEVISRLIYYPIIVALLLIASRSNYFDHWTTPFGLALVIGASIFVVISCAVLLRRKALQMEGEALAFLENEKERLFAKNDYQVNNDVKTVNDCMDRIKEIKTGAFLPISEQPWVRAISLLFGGGGALILFDILSVAK